MTASITGSCHCGTVTWAANLPPTILLNCHCTMCRQLSGADYSSWVVMPVDSFHVESGADSIKHYQATEKFSKNFCTECGATVSCVNNDKFPGHIYVARGNITSAFNEPVALQVYTKDKANWVTPDPAIPVFNPE